MTGMLKGYEAEIEALNREVDRERAARLAAERDRDALRGALAAIVERATAEIDRLRREAAGVRARAIEECRAAITAAHHYAHGSMDCGRTLRALLVSPPAPAAVPTTRETLTLRVRTSSDGGPFVYLPRSRFEPGEHVEVRKMTASGETGAKPDGSAK